jgi:hypothetical protein
MPQERRNIPARYEAGKRSGVKATSPEQAELRRFCLKHVRIAAQVAEAKGDESWYMYDMHHTTCTYSLSPKDSHS